MLIITLIFILILVTSQGDDALVCAFALIIRHAPDSLIYIKYTDANTHTNTYTDTSHFSGRGCTSMCFCTHPPPCNCFSFNNDTHTI